MTTAEREFRNEMSLRGIYVRPSRDEDCCVVIKRYDYRGFRGKLWSLYLPNNLHVTKELIHSDLALAVHLVEERFRGHFHPCSREE